MKKIFTLALAAFAFSASYAQSSQEESRRVILGKQDKKSEETRKDDNSNRSVKDIILGRGGSTSDDGTVASTERQARIDQINRDYDNKIASIRNNPNLSAEEKQRIISGLEKERARKIREVNNEYRDRERNDDDDDRDGKKEKKHKGNNGKHLGWEKGVGNPHRSDSDKEFGKNKSKDRDDDDDDRKGKDKSKSKGKGKKG